MHLNLPVDFSSSIFRYIYDDYRFSAWKRSDRDWQLHLSGGPGTGKTVLATLIAKHLQEQETSSVTFVSAKEYLLHGVHLSAKSLLDFLHNQLYQTGDEMQDKNTAVVKQVTSKCPNGGQVQPKRFLIIDDFDLLEHAVQHDAHVELRRLQEQSFSVLITRAVPVFEPPTMMCNCCDRCKGAGEDDEGLMIYWECRDCAEDLENPTQYSLCETCNSKSSTCVHTGHVMREPYNHINIDVKPSIPGLRSFVRQDLEKEFGAGLNPDHLDSIMRHSKVNINILKLRLDHVRELGSLDDTAIVTDRLPRGIIAFFDAEVERLGFGNANKRRQALLALVASSEKETITFDELEHILHNSDPIAVDTTGHDHPCVQQALESTRGLLSRDTNLNAIEGLESERYRVFPYHGDLWTYIDDDYNKDLMLAKQYLRQVRTKAMAFENGIEPASNSSIENHSVSTEAPSNYDALHSETMKLSCGGAQGNIASNSVCASCRQNFFQSKQMSGVIRLEDIGLSRLESSMCLFCGFIRKILITPDSKLTSGNVSSLYWSIRTMGRTSNDSTSLSLTFRSDPRSDTALIKRFFLLSKSETEYKSSRVNLGPNTNLANSGGQILDWIHKCDQDHTHCTSMRSPAYVPKRLVDIDTGVVDIYRVVHTQKQGIHAPYATLSHSWGRAKFLELISQNEEKLTTQGFSKLELKNKNFVEAIELARFIGVKYIWIDSLCICQGADGDFKEEGQYMHQVYQSSFCNIVAADSIDSSGGVFRERDFDSICIVEYRTGEEETLPEGTWEIIEEDLWATRLLKSPIYTRGWVFQERMLSPRILHFTRSQVFWDCSTLSACEILPQGLPFSLDMNAATDRQWRRRLRRGFEPTTCSQNVVEGSLETFWTTAVLNYTSCALTNQTDKTVAIWSVAKIVRDLFGLEMEDDYACGLWSYDLQEQLAWEVKNVKGGSRMEVLQSKFPSWSWASVNAPIHVLGRFAEPRHYSVKNHGGESIHFSDFATDASDKNKEPQFASCHSLALDGYLVSGILATENSTGMYTFHHEQDLDCSKRISFDVVLDELPEKTFAAPHSCFLLILVASKSIVTDWDEESTYSGTGLILVPNAKYEKEMEVRLAELRCEQTRQGQDSSIEETWEQKALKQRVDAVHAYLARVAQRNKDYPSRVGCFYRRIGAVRFESMSAASWAVFEGTEKTKLWLD